jgi:hypothetical protein
MTILRQAKTIDEACKNLDGTYNGAKALAWLSEVLNPGHGIPEVEIMETFAKVKNREKGHN